MTLEETDKRGNHPEHIYNQYDRNGVDVCFVCDPLGDNNAHRPASTEWGAGKKSWLNCLGKEVPTRHVTISGFVVDRQEKTVEFPPVNERPGFVRHYRSRMPPTPWRVSIERAIQRDDITVLNELSFFDREIDNFISVTCPKCRRSLAIWTLHSPLNMVFTTHEEIWTDASEEEGEPCFLAPCECGEELHRKGFWDA